MYSFDFELPGEPAQIAPFHTMRPQSNGNYFFDPNSFTENASDNSQPLCSAGAVYGCYDPALFGTLGTAKRTICCGPHVSNTDFAILKTISISETRRVDFRAEFFNIFNHTQFFNPDGNTSDGQQFGQVGQARDPAPNAVCLEVFLLIERIGKSRESKIMYLPRVVLPLGILMACSPRDAAGLSFPGVTRCTPN